MRRHDSACAADRLDLGGMYALREGGEDHGWTLTSIANLQHAEGLDRDGSSWRLLVRSYGPVRISRARVAEIRSALLPASS